MKRNRVQFQKGLGPGKVLQGLRQRGAMRARRLQRPLPGARLPAALPHPLPQPPACNACHRRTSLVAGRIFAAAKLPLTVRFPAIRLLTQGKRGVSSLEPARQPGVGRNTAWKASASSCK